MRLLLLLSAGMLIALLVGGGAYMLRSDSCPELARGAISCPARPMVTGNPARTVREPEQQSGKWSLTRPRGALKWPVSGRCV